MENFLKDLLKLDNGSYVQILPNRIRFISGENSFEESPLIIETPKKIKRDFVSLTILPTNNCNLRCIYCYSRGGERKEIMNEGLVKDVLDYFREKSNKIHIRFAGGGEPFLNFNLMKTAISYAKKIFEEVEIHTITNGTFNEEQFLWLKENKSFVRVSFDGLAQNIQRIFADGSSSKNQVEKNIRRLVKEKIPFAVQTIITSKSVSKMKEIVRDLYDLGVRDIKLEPVYISEASRGQENLMCSPKEFSDSFIDLVKYLRKNQMKVLIDSSFFSRPSTGYYCTMPEGNNVLTPEGYLTSCVEISKTSEPFADMLLYAKWDIANKKFIYDQEKLNQLKKFHFSNSPQCINCSLRLMCKGGCPMRNLWIMTNGKSQHLYSCSITRRILPKVLKLISEDRSYADFFMVGHKIKDEKEN